MGPARAHYDVAVIGGGPVGSVTAIAFARRGARVIVLEADPRACRRFAGEWIHPSGVAVLDALRAGRLDRAAPRAGYGFVIFPSDQSAPMELPYPEGVALSCPHESIVECLRDVARSVGGVEVLASARVVTIDGDRIVANDKERGARMEISADRIVGADGRSSIVRRALGFGDNSAPLSFMASVELRDVELPFEGFGHVVLGGPGPALLYRIGEGRVRGCLDMPLHFGAASRTPAFLWEAFRAVLPRAVVPAFRRALEEGPVGWAATRFRPRADFGAGSRALVGDALGHVHPMTAIGLSMGFLDAQSLAASAGIEEYARARRAYVPELLANALYHCFRRDDASATRLRDATFAVLRASPFERRRTMQILCGQEQRTSSFGSVALRVVAGAIGSTVSETTRESGLRALPAALSAFGEWIQWPAAALVPTALRDAYRGRSTSTHPIPLLRDWIHVRDDASPNAHNAHNAHNATAPIASSRRGARPLQTQSSEKAASAIADAMTKAIDLLLGELEAFAAQLGKVPDAVLAGPAMRMMRAITATTMRPGVAARMMIGRRWLSNNGIPRLIAPSDTAPFATSDLAELMLVLLDGSTWMKERISGLDDGIHTLLRRLDAADLRTTALSCRALAVVRQRAPGHFDSRIDGALARAMQSRCAAQAIDGSFAPMDGDTAIEATVWSMDILLAGGAGSSDPALSRAARWLAAQQNEDGTFAANHPLTTSRALRALLAAQALDRDAVEAAAQWLASAIARPETPANWEECSEILEALSHCETQRKAPHKPIREESTARSNSADGFAEPDWIFCRERLAEVSRSFSRPIALLPRHLEVAVTLAYLLCRVADTIEDHPSVPNQSRESLMTRFLDVLHSRIDSGDLAAAFVKIPGDDAELVLARNLAVVMRVFDAQPKATRASLVQWISEMARGMALYTSREPGADGIAALHTVADLERYCYFVAGTVGHLLTDLFLKELGDDATPELALTLRLHAESFGAGLQLVNILKDVTDDRARRWSYIPRTACAARSLSVVDLHDPARRAGAHAVVAPIFDIAKKNLDDGLSYALAIPARHAGIRRFCLLPLWMAARTLVLAKGSDAMFTPGEPVKIGREEVEALSAACVAHSADDDELRARYAALWNDLDSDEHQRSAG